MFLQGWCIGLSGGPSAVTAPISHLLPRPHLPPMHDRRDWVPLRLGLVRCFPTPKHHPTQKEQIPTYNDFHSSPDQLLSNLFDWLLVIQERSILLLSWLTRRHPPRQTQTNTSTSFPFSPTFEKQRQSSDYTKSSTDESSRLTHSGSPFASIMAEPYNTPMPASTPVPASTPRSSSPPLPSLTPNGSMTTISIRPPQQDPSDRRRPIVLHIGDPIRYNPATYAEFSQAFEVIRPSTAERERSEFKKALQERRWGDFSAIFRPFWGTGGEMGRWDAELIDLLPTSVKVFASAGAGFDWADTELLGERGRCAQRRFQRTTMRNVYYANPCVLQASSIATQASQPPKLWQTSLSQWSSQPLDTCPGAWALQPFHISSRLLLPLTPRPTLRLRQRARPSGHAICLHQLSHTTRVTMFSVL